MSTITKSLPARKSSANSKADFTPSLSNDFSNVAGVLKIVTDRAEGSFIVEEYPTGTSARGFMLHKLDAGTDDAETMYAVNCRAGLFTACGCKGYTYKGHCKHADSILALVESGQL